MLTAGGAAGHEPHNVLLTDGLENHSGCDSISEVTEGCRFESTLKKLSNSGVGVKNKLRRLSCLGSLRDSDARP